MARGPIIIEILSLPVRLSGEPARSRAKGAQGAAITPPQLERRRRGGVALRIIRDGTVR